MRTAFVMIAAAGLIVAGAAHTPARADWNGDHHQNGHGGPPHQDYGHRDDGRHADWHHDDWHRDDWHRDDWRREGWHPTPPRPWGYGYAPGVAYAPPPPVYYEPPPVYYEPPPAYYVPPVVPLPPLFGIGVTIR